MPVVRHVTSRLLGILLSLVGLVCVSSVVGGPVSWAVTQGGSMQPAYPPGTLVVLQRKAGYDEGDVVAYRNGDLGATVLHRVLAVEDARLTLRGDANTWTDPYRPTTDEVVGTPVLSVPGVGPALVLVRQPLVLVSVLALVALVLVRRRRAPRTVTVRPGGRIVRSHVPSLPAPRPVPGPPAPRSASTSRSWQDPATPRAVAEPAPLVLPPAATGIAGTALLTVLGLAVLTVVLPGSASAGPAGPAAAATVTFGYTATTAPGVVYPDGRVRTGEPVFLRVLDRVSVEARLQVARPRTTTVDGTWHLEVEVSDDSGWRTSVYRSTPRPLLADPELEVVLTPSRLLRLADRAVALTGAQPGGRRATVRAVVAGTLGARGSPLQTTASYVFDLDAVSLRPAPDQKATSRTEVGVGPGSDTPAPAERLFGVRVLLLQQVLGVAGLVSLVVLALGARSSRDTDPDERLRGRHRELLLSTRPVEPSGHVVEATSLHELFGLAQRYDRLVLHWERHGRHTYLVQDDGVSYRWSDVRPEPAGPRVDVPRPRLPEPAAEEHAWPGAGG